MLLKPKKKEKQNINNINYSQLMFDFKDDDVTFIYAIFTFLHFTCFKSNRKHLKYFKEISY